VRTDAATSSAALCEPRDLDLRKLAGLAELRAAVSGTRPIREARLPRLERLCDDCAALRDEDAALRKEVSALG
jgi:hypothetical protein